eukprot:TRINITY_DN108_c0_g1_i1.p2 TRINITY_DN108_c0_g1~~TRINITY_DN108_c0_g1_i1.p2  ORF type:complete len:133 (-),score=42.17 TRINITY_DN108_c0_g1_i1:730-1128(-)
MLPTTAQCMRLSTSRSVCNLAALTRHAPTMAQSSRSLSSTCTPLSSFLRNNTNNNIIIINNNNNNNNNLSLTTTTPSTTTTTSIFSTSPLSSSFQNSTIQTRSIAQAKRTIPTPSGVCVSTQVHSHAHIHIR